MRGVLFIYFLITFLNANTSLSKQINNFNQSLHLTKEEKEWIKTHKVTIGVEQWEPVVFSNTGYDIDGISGDFTKLLVKKTGLKIEIINDKWATLLSEFKKHKIDVLPATFYTKERAKYGLYSKPYFKMKNFLYVRNDSKIESFQDVKTLAIVKGYGTIPGIKEKFPHIKIIETKDLLESINMVLDKKVDALYDGQVVVSQTIIKNFITGLKSVSQNVFISNSLHYFINKDKPILLSIIQKTLDSITQDERAKIISKWLNFTNRVFLTQKEKEWIAKHIVIKYTFDPDWKPIEWADDIKVHQGILRDILNIIIQRTGIDIEPIYAKNWHGMLDNIKTKKANAYSSVKYDNPNLNFTKHSIFKVPYVFVTRIDNRYIDNFKELKNKKIGVFAESYIYNLLRKEYPNLKFVIFKKDIDGFELLKNKKVDVAIFNIITAKYYMNVLELNDLLKINNKTKYNLDLRIALSKDLGEIPLSIIDKGLASITLKDFNDIVDKWGDVKVNKKIEWNLVFKISLVLILFILFMIFYNYRLNKTVKEKTKELTSLLEAFDKNVIATKADKNGNIIYASTAFCKISGYTEEELIGKPHKIVIHPDTLDETFNDIWSTVTSGRKWEGELKSIKKNGEAYWVYAIIEPEFDQSGNIIGFNGIRHDITAQKALEQLRDNLEKIIQERTKELENEKKLISSIMNSQESIVITTDSKKITTANRSFYQFFKVNTLDEFMKKYGDCICDTFEDVDDDEYLKKYINGVLWIDYVLSNPHKTFKVKIKSSIFTIRADSFNFSGKKFITIVLNDITELEEVKKNVELLHKHTKDSISFASLLQTALLPKEKDMNLCFKDNFVFWKPKDIVGGDIYLLEVLRTENECLLMVIDCTGHGVPGAFVTMIVKAVEREIISKIKDDKALDVNPAWILGYFNKTIKKLLRQDSKNGINNAGFDGGIIYYNRNKQIIKFAGANIPLFYMDDGEFKILKGDKYSVGYKQCDIDYKYSDYTIKVKEGMKFYITTDGYIDQIGGEKGFPFGKKRFQKLIEKNYHLPMQKQKEIFMKEIEDYKNMIENNEQNDDITVVGFEINKKSEIVEILEYEGIITQAIISHYIDIIEHSIDDIAVISKLSTLVIELTQNMMKYSKSSHENDKNIVPMGYIKITKIVENYLIEAKNIISIDDKNKVEKILEEIKSLDEKGLKKRYRELRRSGINTHEKGGGIGFYEIAKISSHINYYFDEINKDKYYFIMQITLKRK